VELYTSWCNSCKDIVPVWKQTADLLDGVIRVAAINVENMDTQDIGSRYDLETIPHIMIFGLDKMKPVVYKAVKEAEDIAEWAVEKLVNDMEKRIKGKNAGKGKGKFAKPNYQEEKTDVVTLTPSNWESALMKDDGIWFVEFYAPWCGHCKDL